MSQLSAGGSNLIRFHLNWFLKRSLIYFMRSIFCVLLLSTGLSQSLLGQSGILVFQSDFGLKDGAVSAMKGVAMGVSPALKIYDVTHEIKAFDIYEAAYRLQQVAQYWPTGTVFVSIVDPGVGSERKSIVLKTRSGHFFVSPDNGTLTLVADALGVMAIREIDESKNRLKGSQESYTFHGRDVYAYTGARLAAGVITFDGVGPALKTEMVKLSIVKPSFRGQAITGGIPVLDVQYGNVWTNIDTGLLKSAGIEIGDKVNVKIFKDDTVHFDGVLAFVNTFADVPEGQALAYINSLMNFSLGINMGNFAAKHQIGTGEGWRVVIGKTN
jgi:S-adenosylmethionine hydrolase